MIELPYAFSWQLSFFSVSVQVLIFYFLPTCFVQALGFSSAHFSDRKVWVGFQIDLFVDLVMHRHLYYFQHLMGQAMPAPVKNCKTKPKNTLM